MSSGGGAAPTVLGAWTATLIRALEIRGVDAVELMSGAGVTSEMMLDPARRVPLEASSRLWRAAAEATGDDAIGLEVSRHVRPGSFDALGLAFLSSATLREGLERAARFSRVTSDIAVGTTRIEGSTFVLAIGWRDGTERPAVEAVDAVMSSIVRTARFLLGRGVSPVSVHLERPQPSNVTRFEQFYRCPIMFDAAESLLAFDRAVVERKVPGGSDRLASVNDQVLAEYLVSLTPLSVAGQVRNVLVDVLSVGDPAVAAVAAELAMSPRSLQRKLAQEGTSFRAVLSDTRREMADALLGPGMASVTEIALRLGFSETAAFSRAYRRWTGGPPGQQRGACPGPTAL